MHFKKKFCCLATLIIGTFLNNYTYAADTDDFLETTRNSDAYYTSYGLINLEVETGDFKKIAAILLDLDNYNSWALDGLDGKDEISKDYYGILDGIKFRHDIDKVEVEYTINLPWPFHSSGNTFLMDVSQNYSDLEAVVDLTIEKNSAISVGNVRLSLLKKDACYLEVYGNFKFSWFMELFLTEKNYTSSVSFKIQTLAANFLQEVKNTLR